MSRSDNIRNFSIIAHVDHGKSTLADRFLELTGAVPRRQMRAQFLDAMELERERGITIKMTPVTLSYPLKAISHKLNLIDTPGHIDFSYEVSRALAAVEGVILLVDATQGVEAQTFTVCELAQSLGLEIVPAVNKIDLPAAAPEQVKQELSRLLSCPPETVLEVSAKTGKGVAELLEAVVSRVPPPRPGGADCRGLVFDFSYDPHRGLVIYLRLFAGAVAPGDKLSFAVSGEVFTALETGIFTPAPKPVAGLGAGEIGYVVTGLKDASRAKVGETIRRPGSAVPILAGYQEPKPMVWASFYPAGGGVSSSADDFEALRRALIRLRLEDAALSLEEESSSVLGRGLRCGFLGLLHLEITSERLRREFGLRFLVTAPAIAYEVGHKLITSPHLFPENGKGFLVREPWVEAKILAPAGVLGPIIKLFNDYEVKLLATESLGRERTILNIVMPLRELMRQFFDTLKSVSSGLASFSYRLIGYRQAPVVRFDLWVGERPVPAFSRIVARRRLLGEAKAAVLRLAGLLPRQLVVTKIQARAEGRILASRTLSARRKDVTGYLYGGDISRKKKLWAKQKRGKKRMQTHSQTVIPPEVFVKMISF